MNKKPLQCGVIESTAFVGLDLGRVQTVTPGDYEVPAGGLSICWPDALLVGEAHDIAAAALSHASDDFRYVVSSEPVVDSGISQVRPVIGCGVTYKGLDVL
jgi:hypothetical protein